MNDFFKKVMPAVQNGGFQDDNFWIWCGSVVKGEDGKYHMFSSRWEKFGPMHPNWATNSCVVRAISDKAEGPYEFVEEVLPRRGKQFWDGMMTHNPTIHKYQDKYLLFYTGTTYSYPQPSVDNPIASHDLWLEARANQRIGLAISSSVKGPWKRLDEPILEPSKGCWDALMTTNPAFCVNKEGKLYLYYKSTANQEDKLHYGLAVADDLDSKFIKMGSEPIIKFDNPNAHMEDAYVWRQNDLFHMIFKDMSDKLTGEYHCGVYATSKDGISWNLATPAKAYSLDWKYDDGSVFHPQALERPQLLIQNGIPTHLFVASGFGPKAGCLNSLDTWNTCIPLSRVSL